jgi:hypothetical protein
MAASQDNSLPSPVVVRVSKGKMYDARMFATIKLMEHLEQRVKEEWGTISADILTWDPVMDETVRQKICSLWWV